MRFSSDSQRRAVFAQLSCARLHDSMNHGNFANTSSSTATIHSEAMSHLFSRGSDCNCSVFSDDSIELVSKKPKNPLGRNTLRHYIMSVVEPSDLIPDELQANRYNRHRFDQRRLDKYLADNDILRQYDDIKHYSDEQIKIMNEYLDAKLDPENMEDFNFDLNLPYGIDDEMIESIRNEKKKRDL